MKNLFLLLLPVLLGSACGRSLMDPGYVLDFPEPPAAWQELLGPPQWRVEWISPGGAKERAVLTEGAGIDLPQTWASPVSAWPFWPDKGISPGIFRPAGAIFPFDAAGGSLRLSWQGGIDAVVYGELDTVWAAETAAEASPVRRPRNFDWPRFRELFDDPALSEKLHADPWTVDWKTAAAKTVSSGFDKRRIVPQAREEIAVPVPHGPWIGASPFAPPLFFGEGERPVFPVGAKPESWFSSAGVLRCTTETWILIPPRPL